MSSWVLWIRTRVLHVFVLVLRYWSYSCCFCGVVLLATIGFLDGRPMLGDRGDVSPNILRNEEVVAFVSFLRCLPNATYCFLVGSCSLLIVVVKLAEVLFRRWFGFRVSNLHKASTMTTSSPGRWSV